MLFYVFIQINKKIIKRNILYFAKIKIRSIYTYVKIILIFK